RALYRAKNAGRNRVRLWADGSTVAASAGPWSCALARRLKRGCDQLQRTRPLLRPVLAARAVLDHQQARTFPLERNPVGFLDQAASRQRHLEPDALQRRSAQSELRALVENTAVRAAILLDQTFQLRLRCHDHREREKHDLEVVARERPRAQELLQIRLEGEGA